MTDKAIDIRETFAEAAAASRESSPPDLVSLIPTPEEMTNARLHPRCIVDAYLYADVGTLIAPGGTGKTTLTLYEMACIALERPLYGLTVKAPGKCLFVTAEDSREICLARLHRVMEAMNLTPAEAQRVRESVLIWDVSGLRVKLVMTDSDIVLTSLADEIVEAYERENLVLVTFDPMVSFGASEQAVNDNEQAIITAARRIRRGLDCCVRFIHHTGQSVAREGTLDQYAGRGGSALADGARMVSVLQPWNPETRTPPFEHEPDASLTILARPKLSYARPNLPLIWIERDGYRFNHHVEKRETAQERETRERDAVLDLIRQRVNRGQYPTMREIEAAKYYRDIGLSRDGFREAVQRLKDNGELIEAELPEDKKQGQRRTYLKPMNRADKAKAYRAMSGN